MTQKDPKGIVAGSVEWIKVWDVPYMLGILDHETHRRGLG